MSRIHIDHPVEVVHIIVCSVSFLEGNDFGTRIICLSLLLYNTYLYKQEDPNCKIVSSFEAHPFLAKPPYETCNYFVL